jgi:hypothetical protein
MASETNELTFVRCPTCRSLVPASASKCRICNAILDAGSKGAGAEAPPPAGGRVRQKTVSAGADEVKNMVAASAPPSAPPRAETPVARVAPPVEPTSPDGGGDGVDEEIFDPLGAFLQDLDASPEAPASPGEPEQKKSPAAFTDRFEDDDENDDDDDLDDLDDIDDFDLDIFDDPAPAAPIEQKNAPKQDEELGNDEFEGRDAVAEMEVDEPVFEAPPVQAKPVAPTARPEPQQREVARPAEPRRPQNRDPQPPPAREVRAEQQPPPARGGQGQIRPRIGGMPRRPEAKEPSPVANQRTVDPAPDAARPVESRERPVKPAAAVPQKPVMQPTVAAAGKAKPEVSPQRVQSSPAVPRSSESSESAGARTGKLRAGRLVGWLVSYEHPDGRAIELRAGRFFVTGTSIRPTDLILEDQSISTPHALMAISENGLQIQDLMSERGTFVRPQGEAQYTREEGVVEVRHGDWIRFGDVEFLVSIVPA